MRTNQSDKGSSLIEILAAFSIAAVALTLIYQIYSQGTKSAILGKEYTEAVAIAESRLDELGTSRELNTAPESGTTADGFHWAIEVKDYTLPNPNDSVNKLPLKSVQVTVSWKSRSKTRSITLQSLKPDTSS